jgi:7-carboxy-7-deazaguanine synthase
MGKLYTIAEHFYSFQGEGLHLGRAAYFIRLYGCDVQCTWCDSGFTWRKELRPSGMLRLTATEVGQLTKELGRDVFVVLTGGEPCLYDLTELIEVFHSQGREVHLETAGHRDIALGIDFITVSPKTAFGAMPLKDSLKRAHQIKLICASQVDINRQLSQVSEYVSENCTVWLHPEHGDRTSKDLLNAIVSTVKHYQGSLDIRAGWQVHKLYKADELDKNTREQDGTPRLKT